MAATAGPKVGFQGAPGAWSEVALFLLSPEARPVPFAHFDDTFAALGKGTVDAIALPIENTTTGSVTQVVDLLFDADVHAVAEAVLPIRHALLARPGVRLEDVRRVLSHPQALDQCARYLREHRMTPVPAFDTAGAAAGLAAEDASTAALASPYAAKLHGLTILARDVASETNLTRFLLFEPKPRVPVGADKTALGFVTAHRPGALLRCLAAFADHGVNLLKLESRPIPGQPWHYRFFVDLEGAATLPSIERALVQLRWHAESVRVFGTFRAASATPSTGR
ncbi:MAG: prephenate dehydratase [Methanobacteriota archaeon]